jgi:hypothetical protein
VVKGVHYDVKGHINTDMCCSPKRSDQVRCKERETTRLASESWRRVPAATKISLVDGITVSSGSSSDSILMFNPVDISATRNSTVANSHAATWQSFETSMSVARHVG